MNEYDIETIKDALNQAECLYDSYGGNWQELQRGDVVEEIIGHMVRAIYGNIKDGNGRNHDKPKPFPNQLAVIKINEEYTLYIYFETDYLSVRPCVVLTRIF